MKKTSLTGVKPTGVPHLGNYLGAIRPALRLAEHHHGRYFIADYHAVTTERDPVALRAAIYDVAATWLACGLDPANTLLYRQSDVPEVFELAWVLSCVVATGQLERGHAYKDALGRGEAPNAGIFFYPVLMAADILLFDTHVVPVGQDQKQHLELTRDLAQKFNHTYSDTFVIPEPYIAATGARIMSLQDPGSKMSKSDPNASATLFITDTSDEIRKKVGSAVTDSGAEVRAAADKPGVSNLLQILSACSGRPVATLEDEFRGKGYGDFKRAVADAVDATLAPVRERFRTYSADRAELDRVLKAGAEGAQRAAFRTLAKVHRKVGFVERPR